MMKKEIRQKLKKRLINRNSKRRFAYRSEWENGVFWSGYDDEERQAILRNGHISTKRQKILNFAKYVDVTDFEYFYLTNHAFRGFVDRIERKKK